jgi:hypothetical protein
MGETEANEFLSHLGFGSAVCCAVEAVPHRLGGQRILGYARFRGIAPIAK